MLDEKDLLAIGQLIDQKLDQKLAQQKQEILDEVDQRMDQKLAQQKEEIINESTHRMKVIMDAEFKPQFNLLAEELSIIREKMVPESRIETIEDQIDVLNASVKRINRELRELKKAQ